MDSGSRARHLWQKIAATRFLVETATRGDFPIRIYYNYQK